MILEKEVATSNQNRFTSNDVVRTHFELRIVSYLESQSLNLIQMRYQNCKRLSGELASKPFLALEIEMEKAWKTTQKKTNWLYEGQSVQNPTGHECEVSERGRDR